MISLNNPKVRVAPKAKAISIKSSVVRLYARASASKVDRNSASLILHESQTIASPPHGTRSSGEGGGGCYGCFLESDSGVALNDGKLLPFPSSSLSSELSVNRSFLLFLAPLLFANRNRARTTPIAFLQHARRLKFSRRLQRSCSVRVAKLVSDVCDSARSESAVGDAGSELRRTRMKFSVGMRGTGAQRSY